MNVRSCVATFLIALCISIFSASVAAQFDGSHYDQAPHYDGPAVGLDALIAEAQTNNPELAALRAQVTVARARPAQERALAPPTADATIWQWPVNSVNPASTNMYMFMVSQDLPGRGKRDLRSAVGEKESAIAEGDVNIRARQIVDEIKQAYGTLYIARKAIDVHLASVDLVRRIAGAAQIKYTTGKISQEEVLKPVLELSKLHADIITFNEQANVATVRLNVLLNRPTTSTFGPLAEPREEALMASPDELQQRAMASHPELQRARLEIERAQAELAVAERDRKPDFSVGAGYMLLPNQTDGLVARFGMSWPNAPWSRKKVDAHVAELTAAVSTAKARETAMENTVRLQVQEAYLHAKAAQERAALLRTTIVPESQQLIQVSQLEYQIDKVDFASLIDNERALLDAQLDYYHALSDFKLATADLERAVGTDLPADATQSLSEGNGGAR